MSDTETYKGRCFCGAVQFAPSGRPEAMAYCQSCRHWSAGPVSAFTLWKPDSVRITQGSENIAIYDGNPGTDNEDVVSERKWCKVCAGHIYTGHPTMGLIDVPAVVIEDFAFKPRFHVHYQETVHHIKDSLPKFKDLPTEAGGSGMELTE